MIPFVNLKIHRTQTIFLLKLNDVRFASYLVLTNELFNTLIQYRNITFKPFTHMSKMYNFHTRPKYIKH
ncbi:hypothetical protein HZS_5883 [Henneguya salminicola]|nr:hypothetical protein HZS_5883 [Henneguya salminicola]